MKKRRSARRESIKSLDAKSSPFLVLLSCVYSILPGGRKYCIRWWLGQTVQDRPSSHFCPPWELLLPPPLSLSFSLSFILCTTFPNMLLYTPEYSSSSWAIDTCWAKGRCPVSNCGVEFSFGTFWYVLIPVSLLCIFLTFCKSLFSLVLLILYGNFYSVWFYLYLLVLSRRPCSLRIRFVGYAIQ